MTAFSQVGTVDVSGRQQQMLLVERDVVDEVVVEVPLSVVP